MKTDRTKETLNRNSVLSTQLHRFEVERIAFDASTDDNIAKQFQRILKLADNMIAGLDPCFPGERFSEFRILFLNYPDGLKIWID